MYDPPPQDFRRVEQASRDRYERLQSTAARQDQLGIQKPKLRETLRHWYRRLTLRKPAGP